MTPTQSDWDAHTRSTLARSSVIGQEGGAAAVGTEASIARAAAATYPLTYPAQASRWL
ncbi:MAG: hypothetical protein RL254_807 [Planctomycetota bacterium]|jgi:hypothetical protein